MDTLLRTQVTKAFDRNPYLHGSRLRWELERGTVVLHGTAPSWYVKQMAQESVRTIDGICAIKNKVLVTGTDS